MPVSELMRRAAGVFGAILLTSLLTLCLAETRQRFGHDEWGVWWLPGKSWTRHFDPVWYVILFNSIINSIAGWLVAVKVTTLRQIPWACSGALIVVLLTWLLGSPLPRLYGQAGQNTVYFCLLTLALAGAYAGAAIAEKWIDR